MEKNQFQYDIALSYVSEDRKYVEKVASSLREMGLNVFYDKDQEIEILSSAEPIDFLLRKVFSRRSKHVVIFGSSHYVGNPWTDIELNSARARAIMEKNPHYIIVAKFDATQLNGIPTNIPFLDLRLISEIECAEKIKQTIDRIASKSNKNSQTIPDDLERKEYDKWPDVPDEYHIFHTLNRLIERQGELVVLGRSNFSWLCGNESDLEDQERFSLCQEILHDLLVEAVENGSEIVLYIQEPDINIFGDETKDKRLKKHIRMSVSNYEMLYERLSKNARKRFKLFMSNIKNQVSYVILKEDRQIARRVVMDLNIDFEGEGDIKGKIRLLPPGGLDWQQAIDNYWQIRSNSFTIEEFVKEREKGMRKVNKLVEDYSAHFSKIRNDTSGNIANLAAQYYTRELEHQNPMEPPVTVQIVLTSHCTTQCRMCNHHKLTRMYKNYVELEEDEIKNILTYIKDIGTNSIIISGGEPLYRDDIFRILEYARGLELNIGLLTNGIRRGGLSLTAGEAEIISRTCSWVQVSLDSFDPQTFEFIRGKDLMDRVIVSIKNLVEAGAKNVETCYTIQKSNVKEIPFINKLAEEALPESVNVRLKFAHGTGRACQKFVCSKDQIRNVIKIFENDKQIEQRFNSEYLAFMIKKGFFNVQDISEGAPVKTKIIDWGSGGYKCHALKLTCIINSNGDVYPCCFLLDDNFLTMDKGSRRRYYIGSLRTGGKVLPLEAVGNKLKQVWYNNPKLDQLRKRILPVHEPTCYRCTRYFFQNEFLNELYHLFKEFHLYGVAQKYIEQTDNSETAEIWV